MAQELPQPLKPVLGSAAWASFAAALAQMFIVAALAALGTLLEQGGPAEFYEKAYPAFAPVILTLGFDHMYSSPFFLGLLAWLAASIIACTGTTQLPLAKRAQRLKVLSADALRRRGSFLMRVDCRPAGSTSSAADALAVERLRALRRSLQFRGFAVRSDDDADPTLVAAQRGMVGKFAPMAVHLALVLVLAGGAAGLIFGASSEVMISDGGTVEIGKVLERGRRIKGPLYEFLNPFKGLMDSTLLKCEDFRIKYRDTGAVEQFYSKLVVEDAKSKEKLAADEIYVNKPLHWGGAVIYQADWAIDRLQLYIKGVPVVVPLKPLPDTEGGARAWGAFLPAELLAAEDVSTVKKITNTRQGVVLVVENFRNVQVYGGDRKLAGILRSPEAKVDKMMEGMPVQFGEAITVDGTELRLDRILGATGLIVKNDPGVPLVYLGFALLMPATLLSVLPFGQVWLAVTEEGQVLVGGRTNRNQPAFEEEMKALVVSAGAAS